MSARYVYGPEHGALRRSGVTLFADADAALRAVEQSDAAEVLLCEASLAAALSPAPPADFAACDLLHAGLALGGAGAFRSACCVSVGWFCLDPPPDRRCTSWKATPACCWLRPQAVRALGGFDRAYLSPEARLMDFGYRLLKAGGRARHDPALLPAAAPVPPLTIPPQDELLLLLRHPGLPFARYAALWQGLRTRRPVGPLRALQEARNQARCLPAPRTEGCARDGLRLVGTERRQRVGPVSALIPTLNRYDYLPRALESLRRAQPPPAEIVVVDQTPPALRRPEVYAPFALQNVRILYLDRAGQSYARNVAIQAASGEWCLLFEDDAEAWPDMLAQHIALLERTGADASTGVSLAPWKGREHIPEAIRHPHLAEVLATGNCLIRKQALRDVGGLDEAFDYGSGADHDLGLRLYLRGYEVVFNPRAIETHHKAPRGGLRTYGAWWRTQAPLLAPYPPPTQVYTIRRHYPQEHWKALYLFYFLLGLRRGGIGRRAWLAASAPWKLACALHAAAGLQAASGEPGSDSGDRDAYPACD